jgi:adenylate cyclase
MADRPGDADEVEELRVWLRDLGATEQDLDLPDIELPGVALNVLLRSDATMSARQFADRCGRSVDDVVGLYRELGIVIDDVDARQFSEAEVDLENLLRTAVMDQFTPQEGHELMVVMARSLGGIADASVAEYVQTVEARLLDGGGSLLDWARVIAEVTAMAGRLSASLGPLFNHYLRQSVEHQRDAQQNVSSPAVMRVAVGFVDLVGFTPLSSRLSPEDLSTMIGRFESEAFDLATETGARIVKHIGDEIMFTAVDADAACRMAIALRRNVEATTARPRGGLAYGEVISRHGDYYGPIVNLASRLTDAAVPGEILVSESLAAAAPDLDAEPAGRRLLKGFDEPVTVMSLS